MPVLIKCQRQKSRPYVKKMKVCFVSNAASAASLPTPILNFLMPLQYNAQIFLFLCIIMQFFGPSANQCDNDSFKNIDSLQ
jgi:hypothetical protein